jgi:FkbM family methyltransferase
MNFDNPAWRARPVRTCLRVAKGLLRRTVSRWSRPVIRYRGRTAIYADLNTPMGLILYRYGHQDPDVDLCARLLSPGDVFVDGGANLGLFTLVAADRVGPSGKVIAFEPGRAIRGCLIENITLNGFKHVDVVPAALADEPGEAAFRVFDIGGAGLNHLLRPSDADGDVATVAVTTLDTSVALPDRARVALIKLDLEGAEYRALLGAAGILRDHHPDLLIELEPSHLARMGDSAQALTTLLHGYGYRLFRVESNAGELSLTPVADPAVSAPRSNVFATTDPGRARLRGVLIGDEDGRAGKFQGERVFGGGNDDQA